MSYNPLIQDSAQRQPERKPAAGESRRKSGISLFVLIVTAAYVLWQGFKSLPEFLTVQDSLAPADAILVLAFDDERIDEGARLYHAGLAPRLVMFAGDAYANRELYLLGEKYDVIDLYQRVADYVSGTENIPRGDFIIRGFADSTCDEAVLMRDMCASNDWRSVIVVTSAYHTRRAKFIFDKIFAGSGVSVAVTHPQAEAEGIYPKEWYKHERDTVACLTELIKLIYYWIRYTFI